jgi:ketosteroid isomerase-like protein
MSQENVELARASVEAYNAGNRKAFLEFFTEDVEIRPDASRFPEAEPVRGREEFGRFLDEIDEGWEGSGRGEISQAFSVGDKVVIRGPWGGTGRASGIDLRSDLTSIYTFRDREVVKLEFFFDHARALEVAGREE